VRNNSGLVLWFTGLSGSGKSTVCARLGEMLEARGIPYVNLDGDKVRAERKNALGFSKEDRDANIQAAAEMALEAARDGKVVLVSFISPYRSHRGLARKRIGDGFAEVYVNSPLAVCRERDVKGLYARAARGEIANFTGVSDPYEAPEKADLELRTDVESATESAARVFDYLCLEAVKRAARKAGQALLSLYDSGLKGREKAYGGGPVTEADLESERVILESLGGFGIPVLSEETEDDFVRMEADEVFIVDPLDGTKDFLQKTGDFSVMIGLARGGRAVLGAVYWPTEDKLYFAMKGGGAFVDCGGVVRRLAVSSRKGPDAVMLVSRNHRLPKEIEIAAEIGIRSFKEVGSAGLKLCLVAEGVGDIYVNSSDKTSEWDICAGDVILSEAGGILRDLKGERIKYNKKDVRNWDGFRAESGRG